MTRKTVGTTSFEVPDDRVVSFDVAYLPASQNDGLAFRLNPGAPRPEEILVLVEPADDVCRRAATAVVDMVPRACAVARGEAKPQPIGTLTKASRSPGISSQWEYRGQDGGVVAACSRSSRGGSCDASFAWRDLVYSISFDDDQIGKLAELKAQTDQLLDEWSKA